MSMHSHGQVVCEGAKALVAEIRKSDNLNTFYLEKAEFLLYQIETCRAEAQKLKEKSDFSKGCPYRLAAEEIACDITDAMSVLRYVNRQAV